MYDRSGEVGATGADWTTFEIEVTVAAYLRMRDMELRGHAFKKVDVVRDLQRLLPTRSTRSIEAKFSNISAVLDEAGLPRLGGYKPYEHYQRALADAVHAALREPRRIQEAEAAFVATALVAASARPRATEDVVVPVPGMAARSKRRSSVSLTGGYKLALNDFKMKSLGDAGEEWVVELERESLTRAGRPDLAKGVEWVARDKGDGYGFDVASFRPDGRERLIEVKTTNLSASTPFYITRWEVEVSKARADDYSLYRVHGFARDPRIYVLDGNIEERARLDPKVFLGIPI